MEQITVALDAMGGDRGADIVVPAAIKAVKKHSNLHLILVGKEDVLRKKLARRGMVQNDQIEICHADEVVAMDEPPASALRYKKKSSMRLAINLVKEGRAQACVSAGNTGALLATARFVLKTLPGIARPAFVAMIPAPNKTGYVRMMDLGANIGSTGEHLFQFAVMGSVFCQAVDNIESPRVALLNIGEEDIKGHEEIKVAAALLHKHDSINYVGFVEGNHIFTNAADIIVCDGFVGNVALKAIEGLASFMRNTIYQVFKKNMITQMMAAVAWPVLGKLRKRLNPALYNGASFLGLRGIVIKSHGGTTSAGFLQAIERAMLEAEYDVPNKISQRVTHLLNK